jgi:hypothetical protein
MGENIKKKNESTNLKRKGMKYSHWIINFILTKGVGKYSENRNQSYYISLDEQKSIKVLN